MTKTPDDARASATDADTTPGAGRPEPGDLPTGTTDDEQQRRTRRRQMIAAILAIVAIIIFALIQGFLGAPHKIPGTH